MILNICAIIVIGIAYFTTAIRVYKRGQMGWFIVILFTTIIGASIYSTMDSFKRRKLLKNNPVLR